MVVYDLGENKVLFEISRDGQIQSNPRNWTISTSHEMQLILQDIVPQVADYFEYLLKRRLKTK
jgi:hypothetical protein